ncbi:hypothetical protein [Solitalea lacus]
MNYGIDFRGIKYACL